jgi:hypothetical protein
MIFVSDIAMWALSLPSYRHCRFIHQHLDEVTGPRLNLTQRARGDLRVGNE